MAFAAFGTQQQTGRKNDNIQDKNISVHNRKSVGAAKGQRRLNANQCNLIQEKNVQKKWIKKGKKGKKGFAAHWPRAFLPFSFCRVCVLWGREDNEGNRRYEKYPIKREEASTLLVLA